MRQHLVLPCFTMFQRKQDEVGARKNEMVLICVMFVNSHHAELESEIHHMRNVINHGEGLRKGIEMRSEVGGHQSVCLALVTQ